MGQSGSYESSLSNPYLKWEKNYNLNIGLDFTLYDRISVTAEYYSRQTKDLLFSMPLSYTSGFSSYTTNMSGILVIKVLSLKSIQPISTTEIFSWTTNLSFSHNAQEIKKINDKTDYTLITNRINSVYRESGRSVLRVLPERICRG